MSVNNLTVLALLGLLAASSAASGQGLGNSPYSRLGLGDYNLHTGGVRQQGMGGVGLAAPNAVQINDLNPALVYYTNRTTYEAAFTGQLKQLQQMRPSDNAKLSQRVGSGNLGYLALAVPISRRWAMSAALRPLSTVDYKSQRISTIPVGTETAQVLTQYSGSGGLSEVALSQGVRVAKGLTVGLTSSYVFGTIDRSSSALVAPPGAAPTEILRQAVTIDNVRYNDFLFRVGAHYRYDLPNKVALNVSGVYGFESKLKGTRSQQQDEQDANGTSLLVTPAVVTTQTGHTTVPASLQLGLSLDNNKNWSLNADVARQQWSKFEDFGLTAQSNLPLDDTWRAAVGGEISPDPTSVSSYFKRMAYRAGVSVATLPYQPNGQTLYDRSVSWGFSLPFPTSSALEASTLNLAFTYGQRGNLDQFGPATARQANVKENYLRAQVGVSLNSRWFLKRRIE